MTIFPRPCQHFFSNAPEPPFTICRKGLQPIYPSYRYRASEGKIDLSGAHAIFGYTLTFRDTPTVGDTP